jgi:hypothetical protein
MKIRLISTLVMAAFLFACGSEKQNGPGDIYYGAEINNLKCKNSFRPEGQLVDPTEFFSRNVALRFLGAVMYGETQVKGERLEVESSILGVVSDQLEIKILCADNERVGSSGYFSGGVIFTTRLGSTTLQGPEFKIGPSVDVVLPNAPGWGASIIGRNLTETSVPEYFHALRGKRWTGAAVFQNKKNIWITFHETFSWKDQKSRFDFSGLRYEIQD